MTETIPQLREKAHQTGNQMDIQATADMEQFVDRLDKRIYDLQLSRQIAIQTAPQIRMIQNVNQAFSRKNSKFNFNKYSFMEKSNGFCPNFDETKKCCFSTTFGYRYYE